MAPPGLALELLAPVPSGCAEILNPTALDFLAALARRFEPVRRDLLARRHARQEEIAAGRLPDFLPETRGLREREWTGAAIRPRLLDRPGGITGPAGPKRMTNAPNSGPNRFMAACQAP